MYGLRRRLASLRLDSRILVPNNVPEDLHQESTPKFARVSKTRLHYDVASLQLIIFGRDSLQES